MTTSIPTSTENNPFLNSVSTSNTQTPEPLRKINKLTILSIVTIVATTLCTAAGIIGAIVTGISGLFALPVVTILLAIAVLIAIHKNRSSKELSIQQPSPSTTPPPRNHQPSLKQLARLKTVKHLVRLRLKSSWQWTLTLQERSSLKMS